ncbi:DNA-3-methyladenine glycosylase family protein [Haloarcula halophila]|uniref:DNA-3-methyladenine glycosylase family protein n=1 Tax=Haloarcula TaxID=2237 RepID=UPI0023E45DB0|nr:DNA-3-methyladenine glycosylase 2 family protein [Halomicroarcula sp. DFY41]
MTESPHEQLRSDEYLGPLVDHHGDLTLDPADDLFQRLVTSILRQQVSMASAAATRERLFEAIEVTPEGVQAADDQLLKDAGLSRQKTRYVNAVADAFLEEGYSRESLAEMDDDAVRAELTAITGVGEWTANMQLLFSLGRPDVFPVGDLGIRKGFETVVGEGYDRAEMATFAQRWAPYRSYASLYLWRAEEDIADGVAEVVEE